ncbi:MAG: PAS domain-containing protein, partial [Acutalibacteraceae bacterium]
MEMTLNNAESILNNNINGFHAYSLNDPVHLIFVSSSLLKTVGYSKDELLSESEDLYINLVHPADRAKYSEFINSLKSCDKSLTLQYRLVKKNGEVLYVNDTACSETLADGGITAYSVLSDITEIKTENDNLMFFNDTVPCGFLRFTCEKQPEITYMNKLMMDFLRFPKTVSGELEFPELYKENIFLLIPMEERRRFALYLNRVYTTGVPIAGELELLRCDGTRMYVFGWLAKSVNESGDEEFQSVCMDVTERHYANKMNQTEHYLKALTDIYDKIFEYDLSSNTVKCLYAQSSPLFKWLENIPMQMEEATEKWITGTVVPEEREAVRSYFYAFRQKKLYKAGEKPPQINYRALSSSGVVKHYNGVFLKMDETVSLYCCRCVSDFEEIEALRNENLSLKENLQELVMQFTEGIAAFEVSDKCVTPLYASNNVCEFFGF